jgi:hypothetical protein
MKPCHINHHIFGDCAVFPYGYSANDLKPCFIIKVSI